jgi:carboxyl-terminal processing protease
MMPRFFGMTPRLVATGLFAALLWLPAAQANSERRPTRLDRKITMMVVKYLQKNHYTLPEIDDDVSEQLFDEYFDELDPNRHYFLQSDLDEFAVYRESLDDMVEKGDLDFGFKVYERFIERVTERLEYVKSIINDDFDFTIDEDILLDRKDLPWPTTIAELDTAWRQRIKNQLLVAHLLDEEGAREEAEKEKEPAVNDTEDPVKDENAAESENTAEVEEIDDTPQEAVVKQLEQFLKFRDENDNADILEIYLSTLTRIFDPHTTYLNWRQLEDFDISMRLRLQGIGATLTYKDGYTEVVSIIPGGPANQQGALKPGHKIIAVGQGDGEMMNVINMQLNKVVRQIRGSKGTKVRLSVIQSLHSTPKTISIVRDEVKLTEGEAKGEVHKVELTDGRFINVGVIDVPSFYADFDALKRGDSDAKSTTVDVRRLIDEMVEKDEIAGIIIDLRSNGGGSLEEAISLSGLFVPSGPIVQVRRVGGIVDVREDLDDGFAYDLPMIVIVNQLSASASEIFSGAIQDYQRGLIVGSVGTHGKGTVQTVLKLDRMRSFRDKKPGAIKFTMAKFYRVTGASTQKKGIAPDIAFPSFLDHMELGEAELDHVLKWDTIQSQPLNRNFTLITPYVEELHRRSDTRLAKSELYQHLVEDIAEFGKRRAEKHITLNREKRIKLREEEEYWTERSQAVLGSDRDNDDEPEDDPGDAPEEIEVKDDVQKNNESEEDFPDVYLDEGLALMGDLVEILDRDNKLTSNHMIKQKGLE